MSWNYRVLKTADPDGTAVWAVHEVYYEADGSVKAWTQSPSRPSGEDWAELQRDLIHYAKALTVRPFDATGGSLVELTMTGRLKANKSRRGKVTR